MKGKTALVAGMAAGYVLGTRDGRERYEQIKNQATKLVHDPRVQEKAGKAQQVLKEKVAPASQSTAGPTSEGGAATAPAVPPVTPATTTPTSTQPTSTQPTSPVTAPVNGPTTGTGGVDD